MTHYYQNNLYLCAVFAVGIFFLNTSFTTLIVFNYVNSNINSNIKILFYILLTLINLFYVALMFALWCDSCDTSFASGNRTIDIDGNQANSIDVNYAYHSIPSVDDYADEKTQLLRNDDTKDKKSKKNKKRVFSLVNFEEGIDGEEQVRNRIKRHDSGDSKDNGDVSDEDDYGVLV